MTSHRLLRIVFLLTLACMFSSATAAKTILVIESYHSEYEWDASYLHGLKSNLPGHDFVVFQMDTKRVPRAQFPIRAALAWEQYLEVKPDLVVLGDDNAVKLLASKFKKTETPVVFLGVNSNPRALGVVGAPNITGVLERPLFKRSIAEIDSLFQAKLKRALILFDSGTTSHVAIQEEFQGKLFSTIGRTEVELRLIGEKSLWQQSILNAKQEGFDAIIIGLYHTIVDEAGKHVAAEKILSWSSENTPIPIFCFWDFSVGENKTAGGLVLFGEIQGRAAAKIIKAIFEGKRPSTLGPLTADQGRYLYSKSQFKKWGLAVTEEMKERVEFVD
ncbi:hypothetical protein MHO82_09765 [Vibrio sp. Of7-15]|uniref:ABC transporter substrate-binding protein n=1 Tax=Vibrio sp. Of7-15 TaxID=2724879 RepID=UPI001EF174DB|nr:ABC transporter substrate binding protein [Vibrio sp. Of7-15]MCG7497154.1 hypothetical protein [Vibrio sp. Of7-15]